MAKNGYVIFSTHFQTLIIKEVRMEMLPQSHYRGMPAENNLNNFILSSLFEKWITL